MPIKWRWKHLRQLIFLKLHQLIGNIQLKVVNMQLEDILVYMMHIHGVVEILVSMKINLKIVR